MHGLILRLRQILRRPQAGICRLIACIRICWIVIFSLLRWILEANTFAGYLHRHSRWFPNSKKAVKIRDLHGFCRLFSEDMFYSVLRGLTPSGRSR